MIPQFVHFGHGSTGRAGLNLRHLQHRGIVTIPRYYELRGTTLKALITVMTRQPFGSYFV